MDWVVQGASLSGQTLSAPLGCQLLNQLNYTAGLISAAQSSIVSGYEGSYE